MADLFDNPVDELIPTTPPRSAAPLFYQGSEDGSPSKSPLVPDMYGDADEVNKIFNDADLFKLSEEKSFDVEEERRKIAEKYKNNPVPRTPMTPHEVLPSSSPSRDLGDQGKEKGKDDKQQMKEKNKVAKLNEALLVGPSGFPQLIKDTKDFKIKGKGHEEMDLNRLLQRYQYWTQRMFPKTQFKDTVEKIEKLCHSKVMHSHMTSWRDEVMGVNKPTAEDEDTLDNGNESEVANYASSSPAPPTRPPSSPGVSSGPDEEDSLIREAQMDADERRGEATSILAMDEDEELWHEFGDSGPSSVPDFDDEGWEAMDDMEAESSVFLSSEGHIKEDIEMGDVAKQRESVAEPLLVPLNDMYAE
ncbi:Swi3-domain-containing protein [Guyanagaster necrorhizus]|uniref:Chromosome segregation in meiosis protein n=1 Tax=Guyanagaster necrorhizus TaxID=856835 RepID=A0A9P7W5D9_9AGAR|nr:Swi3-domain-containing protein [Guyanagaster necrorhizus MCA 3950]KAG7452453.1 Swi3-domain-containing protein [Guyanagaster necrorhizus MCA 3950]